MFRLALSSILCCLAGAAFADEKLYFHDEAFSAKETAAFTRAVGALPIEPKDGDQIRVWFDSVMNGRVTGYIVTSKGAWRCKLRYSNDNGQYIVVHHGNCSGPRRYPERISKVMALMSDAATFDGKGAHCEVMDGWQANIEGMFAGKPFAFGASNTDECTDTNEDARHVDAFVDLVAAAFYKKDDD